MAEEHGRIDLIVGIIFVLFYSANRFNTPATNRSSTTAGRYFLGLVMYCLAAVAAYFTLVNFPHLVNFFAQGDDSELPDYAKQLSNPLIVALLMTVLLPKLPLMSNVDQWIYKSLQNMAAIPFEVRRMSAELRKQPFVVSAELQATVTQKLENEGFERADIRFDSGTHPAPLWTKLTALFIQLEDWESNRRMADYLEEYGERIEKLRTRHEALISKAKTCFKLLRETAESRETDKAREAAEHYAEDFTDQVTHLRYDLLDFISRGILHAELTDTARSNRLAALGFTEEPEHEVFTLNQMMSVFGIVGILMLSSFVVFNTADSGISRGVMLARVIMISVIYSVAVACVVFPREIWSFAKCEPGKLRPVAFYLVAGLMAVGISQLISLGFNCALARSFNAGLQRYVLTYPWAVMTFTTSVVTGILIDNRPPKTIPRLAWRLIEGLIAMLVMFAAAYVTYDWLNERQSAVALEIRDRFHYRVPPLASVLGPAGTIGFAIGFLVPTWCREAPRRRKEIADPQLHSALSQARPSGN